ncbi:MAG: SDR family NAD(P)-dependent oxidoreductase [Bacteroidota bacterium]
MRTTLILGASGEIGSSVAKAFSVKDHTLILVGRSSKKLEAVADVCESMGAKTIIVATKMQNLIELDEIAVHLANRYGQLDTMISCLGKFDGLCPITHISQEDFIESMHVNLHLNWKALQSFEVLLRKSGKGKAIFPIEEYFLKNLAYNSVYGIAKTSLAHMIEQFNIENTNDSISVKYMLMPFSPTKLTRRIFPNANITYQSIEEAGRMIYQQAMME